jgi:hypothetical protein
MIDRRTFLKGAALFLATPAMGSLFSPSCPNQPQKSTDSIGLRKTARTGPDANSFTFKVYGWERAGDIALDRSPSDSVLIRIGRSWRTAWR